MGWWTESTSYQAWSWIGHFSVISINKYQFYKILTGNFSDFTTLLVTLLWNDPLARIAAQTSILFEEIFIGVLTFQHSLYEDWLRSAKTDSNPPVMVVFKWCSSGSPSKRNVLGCTKSQLDGLSAMRIKFGYLFEETLRKGRRLREPLEYRNC